MFNAIITPELRNLRALFVQNGGDIRLVGGCVRDILAGKTPKDIDLCTDLTPDEQIAIFKKHGLRFVETGLQHGTVTVVLSGIPYEITSLRIDTNCDGRHAEVEFTRSWEADLGRRDLTINSISADFDGNLFDPFGGESDLACGIVRFVGNAEQRIREDYLRILRWFRFFGRFARQSVWTEENSEAMGVILANSSGLKEISRERVWMEMSKIISGPNAVEMMGAIARFGETIDLPCFSEAPLAQAIQNGVKDPVTLMVALAGPDAAAVAQAWKWSRAESDKAAWLIANRTRTDFFRMLVDRGDHEWVTDLMRLNGAVSDIAALMARDVPVFPVRGRDLIDAGMKPGKAMGETLAALRRRWIDSGFALSHSELMGGR